MPPLLQSAQLKPDVSITSAGEDGESDDDGYVLGLPSMFTLTFCPILFSYRGCRWGRAVRFFLLYSMTFSKYLGTIFGLILLYRVMC